MPLRVAVIGPESTGKTTLAAALAKHLDAPWVPEHARAYLSALGRSYEERDLVAIARGQLADEDAVTAPLLVCDTNLLVIRIWAEVRYGRVDPWITAHERLDRYALHLLTAPDLPWEPDALRESPYALDELFTRYEAALRRAEAPYAVIRGSGATRLDAALRAVRPLVSERR